MKLTKVCLVCRSTDLRNTCCRTHAIMVHTKDIKRDADGVIVDVQPATKKEIALYGKTQ